MLLKKYSKEHLRLCGIEYRTRPDIMARMKAHRSTPENKEKAKLCQKRPEVKEYQRQYLKQYNQQIKQKKLGLHERN